MSTRPTRSPGSAQPESRRIDRQTTIPLFRLVHDPLCGALRTGPRPGPGHALRQIHLLLWGQDPCLRKEPNVHLTQLQHHQNWPLAHQPGALNDCSYLPRKVTPGGPRTTDDTLQMPGDILERWKSTPRLSGMPMRPQPDVEEQVSERKPKSVVIKNSILDESLMRLGDLISVAARVVISVATGVAAPLPA
jgi:hypothetical protein